MRSSTVPFPGKKNPSPRRGPAEQLAPSANEGQTMRNKVRKDVGIEHDDDAYYGRQRHGMPEDVAENDALVSHLVRGRGGNANGLRVNHFTHDTAGAVGSTHENGAQVELFRSDALSPQIRRWKRC